MAEVWAAAVTAAVAVGSTAYSIASAPGAPQQPNLAAANKEVSDAQAQLLPIQRQLEAAAQQGGRVTVNIPSQVNRQFVTLPGTLDLGALAGHGTTKGHLQGIQVPYVPEEWAPGGKYAKFGAPTIFSKAVTSPTTTYDFTGIGSADVQGTVAKAMADAQLKLSQKYDSQFIDSALTQEKEADPQGFAARQKESDLIQQEINQPIGHPVADQLQGQIQDRLKASQSGHLDAEDSDNLDAAVKSALAARGGQSPGGDFEHPLVSGYAGEQRQQQAAQQADSWLSSGDTPEDIDYRRQQQDIANLSAEINGSTPQSEFKSLSAAGSGPTPVNNGQPLSQLPASSGIGAAGAATAYGQQVNNAEQQVGGWTTGITSALNLASLAGAAGWKPLAPAPTPGG